MAKRKDLAKRGIVRHGEETRLAFLELRHLALICLAVAVRGCERVQHVCRGCRRAVRRNLIRARRVGAVENELLEVELGGEGDLRGAYADGRGWEDDIEWEESVVPLSMHASGYMESGELDDALHHLRKMLDVSS